MYLDSCDKCTMAEIRLKVKCSAMATAVTRITIVPQSEARHHDFMTSQHADWVGAGSGCLAER
jgi:hypothetical protein